MKKFTFALFGMVGAIGLILACMLIFDSKSKAKTKPNSDTKYDAIRRGMNREQMDYWPTNRIWVWDIDASRTKKMIGCFVRVVESPFVKKEVHFVGFDHQLPDQGNDRQQEWFLQNENNDPLYLTCQLIDLRDLGIESATKDQPLRLITHLRTLNYISFTFERSPILYGNQFVGMASTPEAQWSDDGIMVLLKIVTRNEKTLFTHYVCVQHKDYDDSPKSHFQTITFDQLDKHDGQCIALNGIAANAKHGAMLSSNDDKHHLYIAKKNAWTKDELGQSFHVKGRLRKVEGVKNPDSMIAQIQGPYFELDDATIEPVVK